MKIITTTLVFLLTILVSTTMQAQDYKTAAGVRLGFPLSLSLKHFVGEEGALEFNIGSRGSRSAFSNYRYRWVSLSAAYLVHKPLNIPDLEGLKYYFGGGATAYFWSWNYDAVFVDRFPNISLGVQGYIGVEYLFDDIPLSITLDWVPTISFNGFSSGFGARSGSVGIRYILKN